jgi:DNA-binding NarL/FixJ family response regulator
VPVPASHELAGRIRDLSERFASDAAPELDDAGRPLSADETRIAVLAAGGRSNSEIARVLATSVRTVELRLTGIYRTLALTGRSQLASRFLLPNVGC